MMMSSGGGYVSLTPNAYRAMFPNSIILRRTLAGIDGNGGELNRTYFNQNEFYYSNATRRYESHRRIGGDGFFVDQNGDGQMRGNEMAVRVAGDINYTIDFNNETRNWAVSPTTAGDQTATVLARVAGLIGKGPGDLIKATSIDNFVSEMTGGSTTARVNNLNSPNSSPTLTASQ
jgi:hypothetical protein